MRSHLFLATAPPLDDEGSPIGNLHVLRTLDLGRMAIHAHQSVSIPAGVQVIRDGRQVEWDWEDLYVTHPDLAHELMLVEIKAEADRAVLVSHADAIASDATILAGPFPPHYWTDDTSLPPE